LDITFTSAAAGTFIALGRVRAYLVLGIAPNLITVFATWAGALFFGMPGLIGGTALAQTAIGLAASVWLKRVLVAHGLLQRPVLGMTTAPATSGH
jgi:hypothetical protein